MVEISEAITVRADTISLTVISLIITDMDTFLTNYAPIDSTSWNKRGA